MEAVPMQERCLGFGTNFGANFSEPTTTRVFQHLSREFLFMQEVFKCYMDSSVLNELLAFVGAYLKSIEALIQTGQITPWYKLRLCSTESELPPVERLVRFGVFPTAANPFHWMHLISGLMAIAQFRLDKIVYVIAGKDPRKPDLLPLSIRHQMGEEVLEIFAPFFEYSPIAISNSLPGEENLFRLLQLNSAQRIHAFYLAGSDHYQCFNLQKGNPDTIQRLEEGIRQKLYGYCERRHRISVVFLDRGLPKPKVETFLDIKWIRDLPFHCSSTSIRDALNGRNTLEKLLAVPYTVFQYIRMLRLYCPNPVSPGGLPEEPESHISEDSPALYRKCSEFLDSLQQRFATPANR